MPSLPSLSSGLSLPLSLPQRLLPRAVSHRVSCDAPPADVWAVLCEPSRWPEFELFLDRVTGAGGRVAEGQRLLGVSRGGMLRVPIDVRRVVPRKALRIMVHTVPGLREQVEHVLVPTARGGTEITIVVRTEGPLAMVALLPLWVSSSVTARMLARTAEREHRRRLRKAAGVA